MDGGSAMGDVREAHERLVEWGKSLHREPWNYWPRCSLLGRIRDEGAGASQSTAGDRDGGLASLVDRLGAGIEKDRRCAEVQAAYYQMPLKLRAVVDATYRSGHKRDVPKERDAAIRGSELTADEYDTRMEVMLAWLASYLCLPPLTEPAHA